MDPADLVGLFWLLLAAPPLFFLQRGLHREIQTIFLLFTRRADITITLFSVIFFPGVLLHESSHYLMARLLGVRTGRFSLLPRPLPDGKLQLGFVETGSADWLRDALIGAAPLFAGGAFVAYAGFAQLGFPEAWAAFISGGPQELGNVIRSLVRQPDFWLWFYLTLVVSSTMLPSESDRRAWLPLGLTLVVLFGLSLLLGAGPWLAEHLAGPLNWIMQMVAIIFVISALVHLALLLPLWVFRRVIARLMGLEVVI